MTCANCKERIEDGRQFCPACGAFQRLIDEEISGVKASITTVRSSETPDPPSPWGLRVMLAAGTLFCGFGLLFIFGTGIAFTEGSTHQSGIVMVNIAMIAVVAFAGLILFGGLDKFFRS